MFIPKHAKADVLLTTVLGPLRGGCERRTRAYAGGDGGAWRGPRTVHTHIFSLNSLKQGAFFQKGRQNHVFAGMAASPLV